MKAILLDWSGEIKAIDMPEKPHWRWFNEQIGADLINPLTSDKLPKNFIVLTNRETFIETSPVNAVATWLTNLPIAEKAMICKVEDGVTDPEAETTIPLSDCEAVLLVEILRGLSMRMTPRTAV